MGQQSSSSVRIVDDENIVDGFERLSVRGTSVRKTVAATEGIIQFQRSTDEIQKYISDYTKRFDIRWNNVVESHIAQGRFSEYTEKESVGFSWSPSIIGEHM